MSIRLESLKNESRPKKKRKLLGRGPGSKLGKTCGRGQKGMGARSGYKIRAGYIGGGSRLHMRMPTRGFTNALFAKRYNIINLEQIEKLYQDGETVSTQTLSEKGYIKKAAPDGIKVLGKGNLTKKVKLEVSGITEGARAKIQSHEIKIVSR